MDFILVIVFMNMLAQFVGMALFRNTDSVFRISMGVLEYEIALAIVIGLGALSFNPSNKVLALEFGIGIIAWVAIFATTYIGWRSRQRRIFVLIFRGHNSE